MQWACFFFRQGGIQTKRRLNHWASRKFEIDSSEPVRVDREGQSWAMAEISLRFRSPLRSGQRFRVDVSVEKLAGARFVMTQTIVRLPGLELVLEARVTAVFIDERGRPQRIRADIHQALAPYLASTGDG